MLFILCKNNRLPELISTLNLDSAFHQILQNEIHGLLIKDKLIEILRRYKLRNIIILGKVILISFLIFF